MTIVIILLHCYFFFFLGNHIFQFIIQQHFYVLLHTSCFHVTIQTKSFKINLYLSNDKSIASTLRSKVLSSLRALQRLKKYCDVFKVTYYDIKRHVSYSSL